MSDFTSFFNNSQPFGLNVVKGHEKTLKLVGDTAGGLAGGVLEPLFTYLEENENVFNGDINDELNKLRAANFNTTITMQVADEKANGPRPSFDTKF